MEIDELYHMFTANKFDVNLEELKLIYKIADQENKGMLTLEQF